QTVGLLIPNFAAASVRAVGARQNRTDKTDKTSAPFSERGHPRIDEEPHGRPTTVRSNGRLWPNPAELAEALQRLPPHPWPRQPRPFIAVALAGSKRARQPPASDPTRQERGRHPHPVRHRRVQPPLVPLEISAPGRGAPGRRART